jgi:hypothetical protein
MARAAVWWIVRALAREASVGVTTVNRFELGLTVSNSATLTVIRQALERAGVTFTAEGCVCPPAVGGVTGAQLSRDSDGRDGRLAFPRLRHVTRVLAQPPGPL